MLPKKIANNKPTPIISNLVISNANKGIATNTNRINLGLAKLAEPDILSKGLIWLLFVVNLLCFSLCNKTIIGYFVKQRFIKINST